MKDTPNIGHLVEDGERRRDAIHIAVAPVTASQDLDPGDHVALVAGTDETVYWDNGEGPTGIVDPFLTNTVKKGQRFWLFLYPNTITGLRHIWTHPAFTTSKEPPCAKPS